MFENGLKMLYSNYLNEDSVPAQFLKRQKNNDAIIIESYRSFTKNELFTGTAYNLHKNGRLAGILRFNNGKQDGLNKDFSECGTYVENYYWIEGELFTQERQIKDLFEEPTAK